MTTHGGVCITDTENTIENTLFSISPNPTNGNLNIATSDETLIGKPIVLYDILGRQLETTLLKLSHQTLDLSAYPAGMYLVKIGNTTIKVLRSGTP